MGGTLRPCSRSAEVVTFVPEGGCNKERWLLPDFEVLGTISPITIFPKLPRSPGLETESPSCDGKIPCSVPFRSLGQPDVYPG